MKEFKSEHVCKYLSPSLYEAIGQPTIQAAVDLFREFEVRMLGTTSDENLVIVARAIIHEAGDSDWCFRKNENVDALFAQCAVTNARSKLLSKYKKCKGITSKNVKDIDNETVLEYLSMSSTQLDSSLIKLSKELNTHMKALSYETEHLKHLYNDMDINTCTPYMEVIMTQILCNVLKNEDINQLKDFNYVQNLRYYVVYQGLKVNHLILYSDWLMY